MKYVSCLIVAWSFFLVGCAYSPPNVDICINDSAINQPTHEHCAYTIQGADFQIDNDQNHYKLYGQDLTADQYDKVALRISPWSYSVMKQNWLNYCHAHPSACTYATAVKTLTDLENAMHVDRAIVPEWTDEMLDPQ